MLCKIFKYFALESETEQCTHYGVFVVLNSCAKQKKKKEMSRTHNKETETICWLCL